MKKTINYFKKNWKFYAYANKYLHSKYIQILLLPTIEFIYDSQAADMSIKVNDEIFPSWIDISLDVSWLCFNAGINLEIKTNKPIQEID